MKNIAYANNGQMNYETTFETLDWELEARRLNAAFGIEGEFRAAFDDEPSGPKWLIKTIGSDAMPNMFIVNAEFWVSFYYDRKNRYFTVGKIPRQSPTSFPNKKFILNWAGTQFRVQGSQIDIEGHWIIAKGLYHLGLLTDEIETAMQVAVSAHQKIEWTLEYESRCGRPYGV